MDQRQVSPDSRGLVGTDRSGDPDLQSQLQRWAPEASHAKRRGRHFVRVVHGLSVEGDAHTVWLGQRDSCVFPGMGGIGRVRGALGTRLDRIRRPERH
jgi:hypothetical protein